MTEKEKGFSVNENCKAESAALTAALEGRGKTDVGT
jgi:hypothetical protein